MNDPFTVATREVTRAEDEGPDGDSLLLSDEIHDIRGILTATITAQRYALPHHRPDRLRGTNIHRSRLQAHPKMRVLEALLAEIKQSSDDKVP